jgi:hypothetical protein
MGRRSGGETVVRVWLVYYNVVLSVRLNAGGQSCVVGSMYTSNLNNMLPLEFPVLRLRGASARSSPDHSLRRLHTPPNMKAERKPQSKPREHKATTHVRRDSWYN